ncbi:MAG: SMC-Scp complex subunit ScpB [Tissierellaceae bacterium]|nr:SMC-Scp complex subunit ScpB [Tissierellaceae bacterium]
MENQELKAIIEALLFTWGDPLELKDIADVLEKDEKAVNEILDEMMGEFDYSRRGIRIVKANKSYQFSTRPEHFNWIKKLSSPRFTRNLSNAAMETLSIIAYRQPIIKSDIEAIRGVRSDRSIETLMDRGLVKELGRLEKVGRPIIYGTTDLFLRSFGLESLDNLPILEEFNENMENIEFGE